MILELYSIYDKKLGEFLPPFCCKNEADAVRMCSNLVNHSDSLMLKFPDDYSCHKVGIFDTESRELYDVFSNSNIPSVTFEFNTLVRDDTIKYKDILNKIESLSGVLDNKLMLISDKINKLDSLPVEYTSKFDKIISDYNGTLDDLHHKCDSLCFRLKGIEEQTCNESNESVDCPDFLPTNNIKSKSNKSFLDKLFS